MTDQWNFNMSNMTGVISGTGMYFPSGAPNLSTVFNSVHISQSLVFYVVFCEPLLVFCCFFFLLFPAFGHYILHPSSNKSILVQILLSL